MARLRYDYSSAKDQLSREKTPTSQFFELGDYREIPYWFASNRCAFVVMNGTSSTAV